MKIIDDASINMLDSMTNGVGSSRETEGNDYVVSPKINDVGDIGIGTGIYF